MEDDSPATKSAKRIGPTSRGSSAYARKRAVIACQVCRARRTKCDQKKPTCSFCESIGAECISDPPALSAFDPASVAIIERLDRIEREFNRFTKPVDAWTKRQSTDQALSNRRLEHVTQQNLDQILQWPSLQDGHPSVSPQIQFASPLSSVAGDRGSIDGTTTDEVFEQVPHTLLIDQFFAHVHSRNPVLDETKTRRLAQDVHDQGIGRDARSCLTLLIWANGAMARPFLASAPAQESVQRAQASALFSAAEKRMGPLLTSVGVLQAQCFFFAGVYLMSALRPADAWRMFLQALAICRTLQKTINYQEIDTVTAACVYWSAWKSERELNRELDLSPNYRVSSSDVPQYFPSLPVDCTGDDLHNWYFYLSEISAWRLETHAEEELTRFVLEGRGGLVALTTVAEGLLQQVSEWQNSLAPQVSVSNDDNRNDDMLRLIMRARTLSIKELISWPFVYALVHDGIEIESSAVRQWTLKGLSYHVQKLLTHSIQFYHRHHGTWLMIRSCCRSTGVLIAAARSPVAKPLLPSDWRAAVEPALAMICFWRPYVSDLHEVADHLQNLYSLC